VVGQVWRFRGNHAAAGNRHSNRVVGGFGATICADRGISRGRLRGNRSRLYGVDLYGNGALGGCADGPGQDAA